MSAGSAMALIGGGGPARRLALLGAAGELTSTTMMERRLGPLGEPYRDGRRRPRRPRGQGADGGGRPRDGLARPAPGRRPRRGATLMLAGALATRWAVYKAGFQSAADPKYVVEPQRARMAARAEASAR